MGYGGSFSPGIGTMILVSSTYSATDTYNDKDKCNDKDKDKYMTRGGVEGSFSPGRKKYTTAGSGSSD